MLRTKFFVIRGFSNWRTNVILWSATLPWPVSFNNFSTIQTLQIGNKIIAKFVGPFEFNCTRLLFKYFWGLMIVLLIKGISLLSHKSFKELFTSIILLFQLSLRGVILQLYLPCLNFLCQRHDWLCHTFCFFVWGSIVSPDIKYQIIWIVLSDTRFQVVFDTIYLRSRKSPHIDLSLVYSLSNVSSLDMLTMLSPNTKTFLISLVFVPLLAFLISSPLGLSVDKTAFVDFFVGFYRSRLFVICHRCFLC